MKIKKSMVLLKRRNRQKMTGNHSYYSILKTIKNINMVKNDLFLHYLSII